MCGRQSSGDHLPQPSSQHVDRRQLGASTRRPKEKKLTARVSSSRTHVTASAAVPISHVCALGLRGCWTALDDFISPKPLHNKTTMPKRLATCISLCTLRPTCNAPAGCAWGRARSPQCQTCGVRGCVPPAARQPARPYPRHRLRLHDPKDQGHCLISCGSKLALVPILNA